MRIRIVFDSELLRAQIRTLYNACHHVVMRAIVCSHRGHDPYEDPYFGWISGSYCKRCWKWLGFSKGSRAISTTRTRPGLTVKMVDGESPLDQKFESPLRDHESGYYHGAPPPRPAFRVKEDLNA